MPSVRADSQPQRHQRRAHACLDEKEQGEQRHRHGEHAQRARRQPAGLVAVDDGVHRQDQRRGDGERAAHVQVTHVAAAMHRRQQPERSDEHRQPDRQVDQEHPVPAQRAHQQAAQQHAHAAAAGADEAVHAHRLGPFRRLGEQVHDQRQRHRGDHRAAEALDAARDHEPLARAGHAAGERGGGEQHQPEQEQLAVPEQVAQPAAQQQEAAVGQHVGVHHPGQRGFGESEVGADRGQRHVHDGGIQHDHQHAQAEHGEGEPAAVAGGSGRGWHVQAGFLGGACGMVGNDEGFISCHDDDPAGCRSTSGGVRESAA